MRQMKAKNKFKFLFLFLFLLECKEKREPIPIDEIKVYISPKYEIRLDRYEGFLEFSYDCDVLKEKKKFSESYKKMIYILNKKKWKYDFISVEHIQGCTQLNQDLKKDFIELNKRIYNNKVKFNYEDGVLFIIPQ